MGHDTGSNGVARASGAESVVPRLPQKNNQCAECGSPASHQWEFLSAENGRSYWHCVLCGANVDEIEDSQP